MNRARSASWTARVAAYSGSSSRPIRIWPVSRPPSRSPWIASSRADSASTTSGDRRPVICWPKRVRLSRSISPCRPSARPSKLPETPARRPWIDSSGMPARIVWPSSTTRPSFQATRAGSPWTPDQSIRRSPRIEGRAGLSSSRRANSAIREGISRRSSASSRKRATRRSSSSSQNSAVGLQLHAAAAELDGGAAEVEGDVVHRHQAVVVDEQAADVLHRRQFQRRRGRPSRDARRGGEAESDRGAGVGADGESGVVRVPLDPDRGVERGDASGVEQRPGRLPLGGQGASELLVEGQFRRHGASARRRSDSGRPGGPSRIGHSIRASAVGSRRGRGTPSGRA